ncbi:MAG: hypothetical protein WBK98_03805, partial [Limnochordia bacterium]
MSSAMNNQAKTDWRSKLRFSIAARLNIKMWLWLLSFFISLNILLFGAGFILTVSYGERQLAAIAPYLDEIESLAANQLIGVSGISVEQLEAEPRGLVLPEFLKRAVADETAAFSRSFK